MLQPSIFSSLRSLILVLSLCLVASPLWGTQVALAAQTDQAKSEQAKSEQTKSEQAKSGQAKSGQAKSGQAKSGQAQSSDAKASARSDGPPTKSQPQKSTTKGKEAPHASARHMGAALGVGSSWYLDGTSRKGRGAVWERGIPMENLSRKRTRGVPGAAGTAGVAGTSGAGIAPAAEQVRELGRGGTRSATQAAQSSAAVGKGGVDTTRGIDSALGEISSYERQPADGSALGLKKPGVPSVQMTTEESSWRNPVTQPHAVGQEVMTSRRNVVGAYADVVKSDDLHVTLGPELHIPESDPAVKHLSPQQNENSTLGFGMKWQWDF